MLAHHFPHYHKPRCHGWCHKWQAWSAPEPFTSAWYLRSIIPCRGSMPYSVTERKINLAVTQKIWLPISGAKLHNSLSQLHNLEEESHIGDCGLATSHSRLQGQICEIHKSAHDSELLRLWTLGLFCTIPIQGSSDTVECKIPTGMRVHLYDARSTMRSSQSLSKDNPSLDMNAKPAHEG